MLAVVYRPTNTYSGLRPKQGYGTVEILFFVARTEIRNFCTALIMRFSSKEVSHDGVRAQEIK